MLKWLLRRRLQAFEAQNNYDMGYAHAMLEANPRSVLVLHRAGQLAQYQGPLPRAVFYAAKLVAGAHEDCGPCLQLAITFALRAGLSGAFIGSVVSRQATGDADADLAVHFCRAVLEHSDDESPLRDAVVQRFGQDGLTALAFTLVGTRMYPMLKAVLGHSVCYPDVVIDGRPVALPRRRQPGVLESSLQPTG